MNKIKEITQKNACIWPALGSVLLFLAITAVTGNFNLSVISSCAKLCVFAPVSYTHLTLPTKA